MATAEAHDPGSASEQPVRRVVEAAQGVVVDDGTGDAAVGGKDACLRLDLLGGEDAADRAVRAQQRVTVEQVEVAGQLLDAVDLAATLDLDRHAAPRGVAAHQVDRPDGGGVLTAYQAQAVGERGRVLGQQRLEVL